MTILKCSSHDCYESDVDKRCFLQCALCNHVGRDGAVATQINIKLFPPDMSSRFRFRIATSWDELIFAFMLPCGSRFPYALWMKEFAPPPRILFSHSLL